VLCGCESQARGGGGATLSESGRAVVCCCVLPDRPPGGTVLVGRGPYLHLQLPRVRLQLHKELKEAKAQNITKPFLRKIKEIIKGKKTIVSDSTKRKGRNIIQIWI